MGVRPCIIIVILTIICSANLVSSSKAQDEKAYVYEYTNKISVGVDDPTLFISEYSIKGNLIVQPWSFSNEDLSRTYVIALKQLQYHSYYGDALKKNENEDLISNHKNQLEKEFMVAYHQNGMFEGIKFQKGEIDVSKNIKKSIASLLELNVISSAAAPTVQIFNNFYYVEEDTLYGKCKVNYIKENQTFGFRSDVHSNELYAKTITKIYNPNECSSFVYDSRGYFESNDDFNQRIQEQLNTKVVHSINYNDNTTNQIIIKKALRNEYYEWYMDNNNENPSEIKIKQIVNTRQTIDLVEKKKLNLIDKSNEFTFVDFDPSLSLIKTETENKIVNDQNIEKQITKIEELIREAVKYMDKDRLVKFQSGLEHEQIFNKIHPLIKNLNVDQLRLFHIDIDDGPNVNMARYILINLIAHVGNEASLAFTLDLIRNKLVSDNEAVHLIHALSLYMHKPTKEMINQFETLMINKKLSDPVQEAVILGFSHLLSKLFPNSQMSDDDFEFLIKQYQYFKNQLEFTEDIKTKIVWIMAFGNTQNSNAVRYLLEILETTDNLSSQNSLRLRIAIIYALSKTIDASNKSAFDTLKDILMDHDEPQSIRIAAYNILLKNPNISQEDVKQIHQVMASNKNLLNYHITHVKNLIKQNMVPEVMKDVALIIQDVDSSQTVSYEMIYDRSSTYMESMHPGLSTTYKISVLIENTIPVSWTLENVEKIGKKYIDIYGIYINSNFDQFANVSIRNKEPLDKNVYMDVWYSYGQWVVTVQSIDKSLKNLDEQSEALLKIQDNLIDSLNTPAFMYSKLRSFSIPTNFGLPAKFQHKIPFLLNKKLTIDTKMRAPKIIVNIGFNLSLWRHGYTGITVDNILNNQIYAVKTTTLMDADIKINCSISYDFDTSTFKFILPIITHDPNNQFKQGAGGYVLTNVMITDANEEFDKSTCKNCGYETVSTGISNVAQTDSKESNLVGLKFVTMVYDIDISRVPMLQQILNPKGIKINKAGYLFTLEPNSLKSFSQLEFTVESVSRSYEALEKPKFYLPGHKNIIYLSLSGKRNVDDVVVNIGGLSGGLNYSLGETFHTVFADLYKVYDDKCLSSSEPCDYVHAEMQTNYPIYTINEITSQQIVMQTKLKNYIISSFDDNKRSLFNVTVTGMMKNNKNCLCNGDKRSIFFIYPDSSYPMSLECALELLTNKDLVTYESDISGSQVERSALNDPIIRMFVMFKVNDQLAKMMNPHELHKEKLPFKYEYLISQNLIDDYLKDLKTLDKFTKHNTRIISVLPGIIINQKNETFVVNLTNYEMIHSNLEENYNIFVKVLPSKKLALLINYDGQDLNLEPIELNVDDEEKKKSSCKDVPKQTAIYFNKKIVSSINKKVILPLSETNSSNDCLFSLDKSTSFVKIQSKSSPLVVYYTPQIIMIAFKEVSDNIPYFECKQ